MSDALRALDSWLAAAKPCSDCQGEGRVVPLGDDVQPVSVARRFGRLGAAEACATCNGQGGYRYDEDGRRVPAELLP